VTTGCTRTIIGRGKHDGLGWKGIYPERRDIGEGNWSNVGGKGNARIVNRLNGQIPYEALALDILQVSGSMPVKFNLTI